MKNLGLIIFLILLVATAFYFLGKKNGNNQIQTNIIQNISLIKQIAELSALEVNGNTNIKVSNKGNDGMFDKVKDFFAENTIQVTIPYQAKYGVDMNNQNININTKDSTVIVYLPKCKLLSLQLQLDKVDAISKTGLFNAITLDQYIRVQKSLYQSCANSLVNNAQNLKLAEDNIKFILQKYYAPMHLKVQCEFEENMLPKKLL